MSRGRSDAGEARGGEVGVILFSNFRGLETLKKLNKKDDHLCPLNFVCVWTYFIDVNVHVQCTCSTKLMNVVCTQDGDLNGLRSANIALQ